MQQAEQSQTGTLAAALAETGALLKTNPAEAERRADRILKDIPGQQQALLLLVSARRAQGDTAGARAMLELAAMTQPRLAAVQYELGLLLAELGEHEAAITALTRVVELEPDHPGAWRVLGDELAESGHADAAGQAYVKHFRSALNDLKYLEDAAAFASEQPAMAEAMLNAFLEIHPTDVSAIAMLAKAYVKQGRVEEAGKLYARALELAPPFAAARYEYVHLLQEKNPEEANRQLDVLLREAPDHLPYRALKAALSR
jgi:predicted Zn-dependent protease